jgi:hypothetical protein
LLRLVGVVTMAVVAAACSAGPEAPSSSPKPYEQSFAPPYPPEPPAGDRARVDEATVDSDGRTLTLSFIGGAAYAPSDFCSTDYVPWVGSAGADLDVAVVRVSDPDQATAPPDGACAGAGHRYTFHLSLPAPFAGSTLHDAAGGTLWVRPPTGLVEPQVVPSGWQLRWSAEDSGAEPRLWVRVYAPAAAHVTGSNGGRGQLDLYQAFGAATQIGGGPERRIVDIGGRGAVLLRDPALGELLLQWMVGKDGIALVGNEADMTLDQLLAIAAAVRPPGG